MGKDHDYRNGVCTSGATLLTKKTSAVSDNIKVHIFWEGHKNLAKSLLFVIGSSSSQKKVEISQNFCGPLRIYGL